MTKKSAPHNEPLNHLSTKYLLNIIFKNPVKSLFLTSISASVLMLVIFFYKNQFIPDIGLDELYPIIAMFFVFSFIVSLLSTICFLCSVAIFGATADLLSPSTEEKETTALHPSLFYTIVLTILNITGCVALFKLINAYALLLPLILSIALLSSIILTSKLNSRLKRGLLAAYYFLAQSYLTLLFSVAVGVQIAQNNSPSSITATVFFISSIYLTLAVAIFTLIKTKNKTLNEQITLILTLVFIFFFLIPLSFNNYIAKETLNIPWLKKGQIAAIRVNQKAAKEIEEVSGYPPNKNEKNPLILNYHSIANLPGSIRLSIATKKHCRPGYHCYATINLSKKDASIIIFTSIKDSKKT